jgi:amino-acid N-acetyltransferase
VLQPVIARAQDLGEVKALLAACGLPTNDLRDDGVFLVARDGKQLCGVAGLEPLGASALLRSVAVDPKWRRKGIAHALCDAVVRQAREQGARRLYLLTTDAERYFRGLGFAAVDRESLPPEVRATTQFRETCPQTAIAMSRAV